MRLIFGIIAVLAIASLATLTDTRSPSANAAVQHSAQATQLAQRQKPRRQPKEPGSLRQYEQDRLKGWYRIDHA